MATFNGSDIFGPAPSFTHDEQPNAEQINHYPGVVGVERLDLAPRESMTNVRGVFVGSTPDELGAVCAAARSIKRSGVVADLVDDENHTWPKSIMHSFRTHGRSVWAPGWGWTRDYEMQFLHLGITD